MKTTPYKALKTLAFLCLFSLFSMHVSSQNYSLYGIIGDYLAVIDPADGSATEIAPLTPGFSTFSGLTYEPNLDLLLAIADRRTDPRLVSIDRCTGEITAIGFVDQQSPFLDIKLIESMEYNYSDGLLYASGYELNPSQNWFSSRRLMTIDPLTGNATVVSTISGTCQADVDAMAFTANANYVVDGCPNPKRLYTIDLSTGSMSSYIGAFNTASGAMLAAHPTTGLLYSTTNGGGRHLYIISPTTAAETLIGQTHEPTDFGGGVIVQLAFAPSLDQDGDGYTVCQNDCNDNAPLINPGQTELCDGIDNNCDGLIDEGFTDTDSDQIADCVDPDDDNDGVLDTDDNCPLSNNPGQADLDLDGIGDVCDPVTSVCDAIDGLIDVVTSLDLPNGLENALTSKLNNAKSSFADGKSVPAVNKINAFINQVNAQSGNHIHTADADTLIAIANAVIDAILNGETNCEAGGTILMAPNGNFGLRATASQLELKLFPNPVGGDQVNVYLQGFQQTATLTLFDSFGRQVWSKRLDEGQNHLRINLSNNRFTNGMYYLQAISGDKRFVKPVVLSR